MTLVLALGNCDQVVQVSDRQLTDSRGRPCVLPVNKTTLLSLADSRLLVGFAGLARAGRFRTGDWVLDALLEASQPEHQAYSTVERFTELATERFSRRDLRSVESRHRGLSVLFTGYNDTRPAPNLIAAWVTNFQNLERGRDEEPWDEFTATYWSIRPGTPPEEATYIQRIGAWIAMDDAHNGDRLRQILERRAPVQAIIDAGVGVVRSIAARMRHKD